MAISVEMKTITLYKACCTKIESMGGGRFRAEFDAPTCDPPKVTINFHMFDGGRMPDLVKVGGTYFVLLSDTNPEYVVPPTGRFVQEI